MKIRDLSLKYAKQKKTKLQNRERLNWKAKYFTQKNQLKPQVSLIMKKKMLYKKLKCKKDEMELISGYKTKGCIIMNIARWYKEGDDEKNNKYVLNLEKRHLKAIRSDY